MTLRLTAHCCTLLLCLASCAGRDHLSPAKPVLADWHRTITSADMNRLSDWRIAFTNALEKARRAGHADSIAREGVLLDPDAALGDPRPPAGNYHCRVIKLGARASLSQDYVVFPPAGCTITAEDEILSFSKSGGSQRPVGLLFPPDGSRMVFLGTMVLGDERRALEYGRDSARDMVGAFEKIGPGRWRLILPRPSFESMLDVIELVPA